MTLIAQYVEGDFPCAITKSEALGTLCGYIGVPKCHPWYGQQYSDLNVDVHGGLTYGDHGTVGHPLTVAYLEKRSAEAPLLNFYQRLLDAERDNAGKPRDYPHASDLDIWWFGFDCAHLWDLTPGPDNPKPGTEHLYPLSSEGSYKDEASVRQEIAGLVRQAAEAMNAAMSAAQEKPCDPPS